ncbi:anti-sigma factor [Dongia sp.]|uniref:anti-sigma factor family protein n=1 Tax=Dongia sp. TaxID=1977262 RepID=UPI0035AD7BEF
MSERKTIGCEARDAYIDGELSVIEAVAFDQHVAECAACRQELERGLELRTDLRSQLARHGASSDLRLRITSRLPVPVSAKPEIRRARSDRRQWLSLAAAASLAAILASSGTFYAVQESPQEMWDQAVLDSHLRATLSGHVFDVESSDRHTVKPWFNGKTAVAPVVVDLGTAGYPLIGGRLEILERSPLPVLVYRAGPHVISVVVRSGNGSSEPGLQRIDGFSLLDWRSHGFAFTAVSDADSSEIIAFQKVFAAAVAQLP